MPSSNQQAEKAYKKLQGKALTGRNKFTFSEPFFAPLSLYPNQIWLEHGSIPNTAPTLTNGQILGVVKKIEALTLTQLPGPTSMNTFYHEELKDAIPSGFGDGTSYIMKLVDSTGVEISLGQKDWEVDTEAGVLTFFGENGDNSVPANMPPKITFFKYIGAKGNTVVNLKQTNSNANSYTFTTNLITNYTANAVYILNITTANTTSSTISINGLPAKPINKATKEGIKILEAGDLTPNVNYLLSYNSSNDSFQIVSGAGGAGISGESTIGIKTIEIADWVSVSGTPMSYKYELEYASYGFIEVGSIDLYEIVGEQFKKVEADVTIDNNTKKIVINSFVNTKMQLRFLGGSNIISDSNNSFITKLDDLTDITLSSLSDKQILVYNVSTGMWSNVTPSDIFTQVDAYTKAESDAKYALIGHPHNTATTSVAGFMSASDKTKLDGLTNLVKSVNNNFPDANGNVTIATSSGSVDAYTKTESDGRFLKLFDNVSSRVTRTNGTELFFESLKTEPDTIFQSMLVIDAIQGVRLQNGITDTIDNTWNEGMTRTSWQRSQETPESPSIVVRIEHNNSAKTRYGTATLSAVSSDTSRGGVHITHTVVDGSTTGVLKITKNDVTFNNVSLLGGSHPTGDGNLHVPATGTTNNLKVLKAGSTAGSISWGSVSASEISQTASFRFVTDTEKTTWNDKLDKTGGTITGALTVNSNVTVGSVLQVNKVGSESTISFPATLNDPGYIKHIEVSNVAEMRFSVSDDPSGTEGDKDKFTFGATSGSTFTENVTITASGHITAKGNISSTSDITVKANIRPYQNGLEKVMSLNAVIYDRKDIESDNEIGFIAQEVAEVEPALVKQTTELLSLDYSRMVTLLTSAVQEQQKQIEILKQQIAELKNK